MVNFGRGLQKGAERGKNIFIDAFCGEGVIGSLAAKAGCCSRLYDTRFGIRGDFLNKSVRARLRRDMLIQNVIGLMLAPPCSSFCTIRNLTRPIRSTSYPRGIPGWHPKNDQEKLEYGNRCLNQVIVAINLSRKSSCAFCLEHPAGSYMWHDPRLRTALEKCGAIIVTIDQCGFGTSWRKRTKLAFGHVDAKVIEKYWDPVQTRCHGKHGFCSFRGGHKHLILQGRGRTVRAAAYPTKMCERIVQALLK